MSDARGRKPLRSAWVDDEHGLGPPRRWRPDPDRHAIADVASADQPVAGAAFASPSTTFSRTASGAGDAAATAWRSPGPGSRGSARGPRRRGAGARQAALGGPRSGPRRSAPGSSPPSAAPARRRRAGPRAAEVVLPLLEEGGVGLPEHPPPEPGVDRFAAVAVVVVVRDELDGRHRVLRPQQRVDALHRGELDARRVPRPVASRGDHQHRRGAMSAPISMCSCRGAGSGRSRRRPRLHVVRDHVDRGGDLDPVVHRGQQEGLRAAAGGPVQAGGSCRRQGATRGSPPSGCCSTGAGRASRSPLARRGSSRRWSTWRESL